MFATIKAYLWIAPYVLIALLVAAISYYRNEVTTAEAQAALTRAQLESAVATNAQQVKTITALIELRAKADEIVSTLTDNLAEVNQNISDQTKAFNDLKDTDPDVKNFTNGLVPNSVKRLHNR